MATSRPPDRNARIVDAVGREVYERLKEETPLCGSVLDRLPAHLRAGTPEPLDSVAHRSLYAHMPVEIRAAARQKPLRVILEAADEDALTNLKVQKLCYYAAGLIAAVRGQGGKPLFREQIEAWQHGPVVPTEYFRFSQFGGSAIPPQVNFDDELIEPRDLAVSNDVYGYYGQYSAWKLRNMTHEEAPWIAAWNRDDKVISNEELRLFFEKEVGEEYTSSYAASSRERGNSRQSGLMCRPSWRASYQDASRFAN